MEVVENIVLCSFNVHINHLGILLKCGFNFSRFGWSLRYHISNELLGDIGPRTTI